MLEPSPYFLIWRMASSFTPKWWWWWPDFWLAGTGIAIEKSHSILAPDPFNQSDSSLWKVWCLLFFHCVHLFIYPDRYSVSISETQFWEILLIYSFDNPLLSIFLFLSISCTCLELLYVGFRTTRIESFILLFFCFPSLPPPTLCSWNFGKFPWLYFLFLKKIEV